MKSKKNYIFIIIGTYIVAKLYTKLYNKMLNDTTYLKNIISVRKRTMSTEVNESVIREAQSLESAGQFVEAANYYLYVYKTGYDADLLMSMMANESTKAIFLSEMDKAK